MSGGSRRDPTDPRCPACDGKVGATSVYCMHCGADLLETDVGADSRAAARRADDSADVSDADDVSWGATDGTVGGRGDGGGAGGGGFLRDLFAPDGLLDDSLTVVVGAGAGLLAGVLALFVVLVATGHEVALLAGFVVWLAVTAVLVRQRTVFGAVRLGCYALAVLLLVAPVTALSPVVTVDGGFGSRVALVLIFEALALIPVAVLLVAGFLAGRARPDEERDAAPAP